MVDFKSQFIEQINQSKTLNFCKFGNIISYLPKSSINANEAKDKGKYPFFTSSVEQNKYIDTYLYDDSCLIIGNGGVANVQYYDGKFSAGTHSFVAKSANDNIETEYLYRYFYSNLDVLEEGFRGVGIKNVPKEYINNLEIPVPSIDEQKEMILLFKQSDKSKFYIIETNKNLKNQCQKGGLLHVNI